MSGASLDQGRDQKATHLTIPAGCVFNKAAGHSAGSTVEYRKQTTAPGEPGYAAKEKAFLVTGLQHLNAHERARQEH